MERKITIEATKQIRVKIYAKLSLSTSAQFKLAIVEA